MKKYKTRLLYITSPIIRINLHNRLSGRVFVLPFPLALNSRTIAQGCRVSVFSVVINFVGTLICVSRVGLEPLIYILLGSDRRKQLGRWLIGGYFWMVVFIFHIYFIDKNVCDHWQVTSMRRSCVNFHFFNIGITQKLYNYCKPFYQLNYKCCPRHMWIANMTNFTYHINIWKKYAVGNLFRYELF